MKVVKVLSQIAFVLISAIYKQPLLLLNTKQWLETKELRKLFKLASIFTKYKVLGWNSAAVITSFNSFIFPGFISIMATKKWVQILLTHLLKASECISKFHKLILKSSAEINNWEKILTTSSTIEWITWWSEQSETLLIL